MRDKNNHLTETDSTSFKLPLSVFEYYMFLDDCAGNTMTLPLSLSVEGKVDRAAMDKAYFEACELHPLFCSIISKQDKCWHKVDKPEGIIWIESDAEDYFIWDEQYIDITQTTGIRFAIVNRGDLMTFHFLFHHCISDGVGYFQFLNSLFSCYLKNIGQNVTPVHYDAANLANRTKYNLAPPPKPVSFFSAAKFIVVETLRWLIRRPLSPVSKSISETTKLSKTEQTLELREVEILGEQVRFELRNWGNSGFLFVRLNQNLTSRIIKKSKSNKLTIGDILLSSLFISLANSKYLSFAETDKDIKEIRDNEFLRIGLVNNMRGLDAETIPACNMISYSFPTRRFIDCRDNINFYKKMSEEMRYIKDYNVGKTFIDGLSFFMRVPFFMKKFMASSRCLASVILSSMNRLELSFSSEFPRDESGFICVGEMKLLELYSAAPYRRGTPISITTNTYAGQLGLFVQYDTKKVTPNDATNWLIELINTIAKDIS
ncbi:MAG: hypothetical protein LBH59_07820 [Planctomycetaceae bacterium]|jgi:hypothetical protein|nr:hypothetical protein [Planctomycetaceae bacterium]